VSEKYFNSYPYLVHILYNVCNIKLKNRDYLSYPEIVLHYFTQEDILIKLKSFDLEQWFANYEFKIGNNLAASCARSTSANGTSCICPHGQVLTRYWRHHSGMWDHPVIPDAQPVDILAF